MIHTRLFSVRNIFLFAMVLALALGARPLVSADQPWRAQGIIDTTRSPYAKLHSVPVHAVTMGEGFWTERMRTNVEKSIPTLLALLEEHGIVDNFRRLSGRKDVPRRGPLYTDSDLYKWMEAAAYVLAYGDHAELRSKLDAAIDDVLAAQEPSGYLNTYYTGDRVKLRFTEMYRGHELYCLGHLLQAGIAYYRATGNRKLLDGGIKFADYLIKNFGPDKRPALTGHPELEMALVELYRTTGEKKYLDFAGYLLHGDRERLGLTDRQITYMFSGIPFTSRTEMEGHAVRALYACSGATDYYLERGDPAYRRTLEQLWRDLVERKMYVTGGVGSRSQGESIGAAYELPNQDAYTESCAAIANFMWNWRLFAAFAEARFTDVMERALYNGINSGMSLSGTLYCYRNPLAARGDENIRNPWYETTCCPPNLERTFAELPGYLYSTSSAGVYVNLYHSSELAWHLEDGTGLDLRQKTEYPWQGSVTLEVAPATASTFSVFLRVPGWSRATEVKVNGSPAEGTPKLGEYFEIRREWKPGDTINLEFDMTPRLVAANPRVREDVGRVAVQRGPLVYCLEQTDLGEQPAVSDVLLPVGGKAEAGFTTEFRPDLLGGVVVLRYTGAARSEPSLEESLYSTWKHEARAATKPVQLTFIPYYAWANRQPGAMEVWVPYTLARED